MEWTSLGRGATTNENIVGLNSSVCVFVLQLLASAGRGQACRPVELRLWSSSWEGRKPVGLEEGGFAAAPLLSASSAAGGVLEGSNTPNASCHSLLKPSLAPGPGLSRSFRKAMSPRSTSSSSVRSTVPGRREGPPTGETAASQKGKNKADLDSESRTSRNPKDGETAAATKQIRGEKLRKSSS